MSKRRLIFYNDSRHSHMYCYEPPMRIEDAQAPVDEIAGTGVDTFAYGLGLGPTMFHDTRVGEIMGSHLKEFSQDDPNNLWALSAWRAYENVRSLIERGTDPLEVIVSRAHEKGMEFIGSFRTTHGSDPTDLVTAHSSQFKIDHPEWCLKGNGKYNFNWVHPEVRAERFALIEEVVKRYDIDGIEVDWVFAPHYFEEAEVEQNRHVLTEFLRDVRGAVRDAAEARGRPMELGARVLPTLSGNLAAGLDVSTWLEEKLLDFVVPSFYGDHQIDADFPFEWLVERAHQAGCEVYPALQSRVLTVPARCDYPRTDHLAPHDGESTAGVDHYRAGAAAYWSKGADAIYLPWFKWPVGAEQRQVLSEIHDPDLLREKRKHYVVRRHHEAASGRDYTATLPLRLPTGLDAPARLVDLFVADGPGTGEATLRVRLMGSTTHDSMTVSINGTKLPWETCRRTEHGGYFYTWLEFTLAPGVLRKGRNEVGVAVHSRPSNLAVDVVLQGVELVVSYPEQRPG
jgi:hypothetical protein